MNWYSKLFPGPCTLREAGARGWSVHHTQEQLCPQPSCLHLELPHTSTFQITLYFTHTHTQKPTKQPTTHASAKQAATFQTFPLHLISQLNEGINTFSTAQSSGEEQFYLIRVSFSSWTVIQPEVHMLRWYYPALISEGPQGIRVLCNWISGAWPNY